MSHDNDVQLSNYSSELTEINQIDTKEGILNYPFDHIYACNVENTENVIDNNFVNSNQSESRNLTESDERAAQLSDSLTCTRNEIRQLKDLLLLHLDLIQQQSEQLLNKDKVISALKQENDTLKLRLGRVDRRVTTKKNILATNSGSSPQTNLALLSTSSEIAFPPMQLVQSNENECYDDSNSSEIDSKDNIKLLSECFDISKEHGLNISNCIDDNDIFRRDSTKGKFNEIKLNIISDKNKSYKNKFGRLSLNKNVIKTESQDFVQEISNCREHNKSNSDTQTHSTRKSNINENSSSIIGENDGKVINKIILQKIHFDNDFMKEDIDNTCREIEDINHLTVAYEEIVSNKEAFSPTNQIEVDEELKEPEIKTNFNNISESGCSLSVNSGLQRDRQVNRKRALSSCSQNSSVSQPELNTLISEEKQESKKKRRVLTSPQEYYTTIGETEFGGEEMELEIPSETAALEVPRWREHIYTTCHSEEGVENMDDQVFAKRHQKWESEERRRKRWDVQRIREQRNIERLKSRQSRASARGGASPGDQSLPVPTSSLWPDPQSARFVHITEQLPVCALGEGVPAICSGEFKLPWYNYSVQPVEESSQRHISRTNRRRRRQKRQRNKR